MELKETMTTQQSIQELKSRMSASIIGQDQLIERIILVLLRAHEIQISDSSDHF